MYELIMLVIGLVATGVLLGIGVAIGDVIVNALLRKLAYA